MAEDFFMAVRFLQSYLEQLKLIYWALSIKWLMEY